MTSDCVDDCRNVRGVRHGRFDAAHFADCLDKLSCSAIERSLVMDSGPAGECYSTSLAGNSP